jgi:hypothetical protein
MHDHKSFHCCMFAYSHTHASNHTHAAPRIWVLTSAAVTTQPMQIARLLASNAAPLKGGHLVSSSSMWAGTRASLERESVLEKREFKFLLTEATSTHVNDNSRIVTVPYSYSERHTAAPPRLVERSPRHRIAIMPQTFRVVRCFDSACHAFQVDQVKKTNKFTCKICQQVQSVRKVSETVSGPVMCAL